VRKGVGHETKNHLVECVARIDHSHAIAGVEARGSPGWGGHRWGHFGPGHDIEHDLKLTGAEREQIKTICQAERPTVSKLVREISTEAGEMDVTTTQGKLDERKIQEIAARQGASIARLLMEKERLKSRIYRLVLNPGQRTKADELQLRWRKRLDQVADQLEK
jgi:Spy/CpxP family protein refolding chaperone